MAKNESSKEKTDLTPGDFPQFEKDSRGRMRVPGGWRAPDGFRGTVVTPSGIQLSYGGRMRKAEKLPDDNSKKRKPTLAEGK